MEKGGIVADKISGERFKKARNLKHYVLIRLAKKFELDLSTLQKWQRDGIPDSRLSLVAHHFGVEEWVFTDKNLSTDDFIKIIFDPKLMDKFRPVKEKPSPLPEITGSLPEPNIVSVQSQKEKEPGPNDKIPNQDFKNIIGESVLDFKNPEEMFLLGEKYYLGNELKKDHTKAFELFSESAKQGYAKAYMRLAEMYEDKKYETNDVDNYDINMTKAIESYSKASELGDHEAEVILGNLYSLGEDVTKDQQKAFEWFSKAAEGENPEGLNSLALDYLSGDYVKQDYTKAIELLSKAAEQNHVDSLIDLGNIYYHGTGVAQNISEALKYYLKAEELGEKSVQARLGLIYRNDHEGEKAFKWFSKAAERGDPEGLEELGLLYYDGIFVKKDLDRARMYFEKASDRGSIFATCQLASNYLCGGFGHINFYMAEKFIDKWLSFIGGSKKFICKEFVTTQVLFLKQLNF